jgi:hypothetical protein
VAVAIDQGLERESALRCTGGGDDRFSNSQGWETSKQESVARGGNGGERGIAASSGV